MDKREIKQNGEGVIPEVSTVDPDHDTLSAHQLNHLNKSLTGGTAVHRRGRGT